jgi:hypothetical protein
MPFPPIAVCIVCELVRIEPGSFSILGFHGIAPDVRIGVPTFPGRLDFLTLALLGTREESGTGDVVLEASVIGPQQQPVWIGDRQEVNYTGPSGSRLNLFLRIAGPVFPVSGIYTFHLRIDGVLHYQTTLEVVRSAAD